MAADAENYALAFDACSIAIGGARRGDIDSATSNLALARKLDPICWMLDRATRELAQVQNV